jgi:penicillin amidase
VCGVIAGCSLLRPLPRETTLDQRLAAIPTRGLPIGAPVRIYWDEHQIPFIEATDDLDAAFALGLVHAHLRLGQMAIYREIAYGRISEIGGVLAADIDHGLRILDYGRATAEIEAALPAETRAWLERFVAGVNLYQERMATPPFEYTALGLDRRPWTVRDVLTFGRLAGTDVTWLVWFNLLRLRDRPDWPELWARLVENGGDGMTSFGAGSDTAALGALLAGLSRSGSNSLAIDGRRSRSGAALIANDPHLGINLPNTWLIVGLKSPSYHVVGLMVPGLPIFGIGRNPDIAWGGTNMRAAASDLVDLSDLPETAIRTRRETIRIRWWPDREVTVRDSDWGPIVSDAPQFAELDLPPLALRWTGHAVSDEVGAFLRVARARGFDEFRSALAGFSVPGQNMLYADRAGNIGQVLAVRVPDRDEPTPADMVVPPATAERLWSDVRGTTDLPFSVNPAKGFLASANNRPTGDPTRVGYFFSPDDRVARMTELVGGDRPIGMEDLRSIQQDVYVKSSVMLRDALVAKIDAFGLLADATPAQRMLIERMRAWDGHYRPDSQGAVAFELFRHAFTEGFYQALLGEADWSAFANVGRIKALLLEDVGRADRAGLAPRLREAMITAAEKVDTFAGWGEMHRLALHHPLHFLPVIGGRFRFGDHPIGGSTDALMKTAHAPTDERHDTRYGANARHISDLSDPDLNFFVILGGQDGWLNSANFVDQVPLWLEGGYVQVPLRMESVRSRFGRHTDLKP